MDHPSRCGMTFTIEMGSVPSRKHESSCLIDTGIEASFEGYISLPASCTIDTTLLGLDATQPFPDAIAYATDPIGEFTIQGGLAGSDALDAITLALEFDSGNGTGGSGASDAAAVTYDNTLYTTVQAALDALLYVAPHINSFTNNVGTVEKGSTITSVTLSWTFNKAMTTVSLNQGIGAVPAASSSKVVTGTFTTDTSWTLTADDGVNFTSANTGIAFRQKRYWGVSSLDTLTDADIIGLGGSEFASNFNKAITYNCTGGKYPYLAFPASFGSPSNVTVGGLAFSDFTVATQDFTNASGLTESYHVVRFNGIQTGASISVVWA